MTKYIEYRVSLTDGQKENLAKAYRMKYPHTFRLKYEQLHGNFPMLLTQTQIKQIEKAKRNRVGLQIKISKEQMRSQGQSGDFLGALAGLLGRTVLPIVTKIAPKILGPLGVGALSGLASTGVSKILGNGSSLLGSGMISIANNKRNMITPYLTPAQQRQLHGTGVIKLTQKQKQDGGFLGMLAASLGIPLITSLLSGKGLGQSLSLKPKGRGLQVDSQQVPYRRIPRGVKKNKI